MKRLLFGLLLLAPLVSSLGCATCCAPDDYSYPTYGGRWQRVDPVRGRVGSSYSPEVWTEIETMHSPPLEETGDNAYYTR